MELDSALILDGGCWPSIASLDPRQREIEARDVCWQFAKCCFSISVCDIGYDIQAKDWNGATSPSILSTFKRDQDTTSFHQA
jgi:hypothetical protein